ncbi:MAG: hypothetical protein JRJ85_22850 [Deltaproteobacteria bacterium]|nr:hypothetical protein [Deltaproteobacteria bacterium]
MDREGVSIEDRYYIRSMDMRYKGQFHELEIPLPEGTNRSDGRIDGKVIEQLIEDFHEMYETLYSYRDATTETEVLNLRLKACGRVQKPPLKREGFEGADSGKYKKGERRVFFEEMGGFVRTDIFDGEEMKTGNLVQGPAIVELKTTTVVVPPEGTLEVTPYDSFFVELD